MVGSVVVRHEKTANSKRLECSFTRKQTLISRGAMPDLSRSMAKDLNRPCFCWINLNDFISNFLPFNTEE